MPFGRGFNNFFDIRDFEWSVLSITLGGILLIGAILCCLVGCLLVMVITLSFDCWWTLGTFFNIEKRMEIQFAETRKTSGTTQIGQKKKIKNTKYGRKTLTLVQKYSTSPKSMKSANNFNISFNQNSAFNDTLETFTAFV